MGMKLTTKTGLSSDIRSHVLLIILLSLAAAGTTLAGFFALDHAFQLLAVSAHLHMAALVVALLAIRKQSALATVRA